MSEPDFKNLPPVPAGVPSAGDVIVRLLDATAFRYHFALAGLDEPFLTFRAAQGGMSVLEVLQHIHALSSLFCKLVGVAPSEPGADGLAALRQATLANFQQASAQVASMNEPKLASLTFLRTRTGSNLSVLHFVNGPLADALTHIGQLNTWRRAYGVPPVKVDYFEGKGA